MKHIKLLLVIFGLVATLIGVLQTNLLESLGFTSDDSELVAAAVRERRSNLMVEVKAEVLRSLPDEEISHAPHQRFLIRLDNGVALMVTHNLDISRRIPISVKDRLRIRGEYDWNYQGGLIHWTHSDPEGQRAGGWIELGNQLSH